MSYPLRQSLASQRKNMAKIVPSPEPDIPSPG
jgi:hypothetical protein